MSSRIQPDAPHPDSYRPDLPLRSELLSPEIDDRDIADDDDGYDEGFEDGVASIIRKSADRITALEAENTRLRTQLEKSA